MRVLKRRLLLSSVAIACVAFIAAPVSAETTVTTTTTKTPVVGATVNTTATTPVITTATTPVITTTTTKTPTTTTYRYDMDGDGFVEPNEFATYVTYRSDMDNDGFIQPAEYDNYTTTWYKYYDMEPVTYLTVDANSDSRLESSEVVTLINKSNFYSTWDTNADSRISNAEFAAGTFMAYDDNKDGVIDKTEWMDVAM